MGYNTTILILNDGLDQLRKNPVEFTEKVWNAIASGRETTVGVGNHCNVVTVMPTQHADLPRLYFTHGNSITELSPYNRDTLDLVRHGDFRRDHVINSIKTAERYLRELKKAVREVDAGVA